MPFLKWIGGLLIEKLLNRLLGWAKRKYKAHEEKKKNKEAIEKVKNSKTDEEIDEALDAITDRSNK